LYRESRLSSLRGAGDDVPQPKPCVLTYFFFVELQLHRPAAVNAWQLVG
jgi:hypothetical protein